MDSFDVIVVGGGNAGLSAALAARRIASRVLLLERGPEHMRGGNSRHTRNIRCAHASADGFFSGSYSEEEFLEDLIGVTGSPDNLDLAKFAICQSSKLPAWMSAHGAAWQQPLAGTLSLGRTNRWFLGGGKALLNAYYRTAQKMGISVRYNAFVEDLVDRERSLRSSGAEIKWHAGTRAWPCRGAGCRGIRSEYRMAQASLGRGRRKFHRSRHALQRRHDFG